MNQPGSFNSEEFDAAFHKIYLELISLKTLAPAIKPRAYLLGGQSGAGKTFLHGVCLENLGGNAVIINGDEYRATHPRYYELDNRYGPDAVSYTAEWSGEMVKQLIASLSRLTYNLIIEGTLRTAQTPLSTAQDLRQKGYAVSLALMAVKPEISLISCQIRYEEMRLAGTLPRATDPAHHRLIVENIADNLAVLEESGQFDGIELFSRTGRRLYPQLRETRTAHDALRAVLFGEWNAEEQYHYRFLRERLEILRNQAIN